MFFLGDLKNVTIACESNNQQGSSLLLEQNIRFLKKENDYGSHHFDDEDQKKKGEVNNTLMLPPGSNENQYELTNGNRRQSIHDDNALRVDDTDSVHKERLKSLSSFYQGILSSIGEDPSRQG